MTFTSTNEDGVSKVVNEAASVMHGTPPALTTYTGPTVSTLYQGLTLVQFSAQRKRFERDRGCI